MALYQKKEEERVFIRECIRLYRELPALWDTTSDIYKNKYEKSRCYDILLSKYRQRYSDATKEDLKKKINSLRTNYRKELKKQQDSKLRNGCNYYGEVYVPSLFYFEDINFLHGQEAPSLIDSSYCVAKNEKWLLLEIILKHQGLNRSPMNMIDSLDQSTAPLPFNIKEEVPISFPAELTRIFHEKPASAYGNTASTILAKPPNKVDNSDIVRFCSTQMPSPVVSQNQNNLNHHHLHHQNQNGENINNSVSHNPHLLHNSIAHSQNISTSAVKCLSLREGKSTSTAIEEDEFYHQAKVWAKEISKMTPDQQLFAKKAINDILFEGQLGGLHRNSVKINCVNNGFDSTAVAVGAPEVAMFVPGDDNDDVSSGSMSPPPVSFQT